MMKYMSWSAQHLVVKSYGGSLLERFSLYHNIVELYTLLHKWHLCILRSQSLKHNPNGRFVVVCGDGEYIIYTALAWRNRSFGSALEFAWSNDGECAVRESTSKIKIFNKSFQVFCLNYGSILLLSLWLVVVFWHGVNLGCAYVIAVEFIYWIHLLL